MSIRDPLLEKAVAKRTKAEREFDATPAGIAALRNTLEKSPQNERYRLDLDNALELRAAQLKLLGLEEARERAHSSKDAKKHLVQMEEKYGHDFLPDDFARIGLEDTDSEFFEHAELMSQIGYDWAQKLEPEEMAALSWLTDEGTEVLSRHAHGSTKDDDYYKEPLSDDVIAKRSALVKSALEKAPRTQKPVVIYRGVGSQVPFDLEAVRQSGVYEAKSHLSASVNPGIAHMFGYKNIILEVKTTQIPSLPGIGRAPIRELEVLMPQGSKYRVVEIAEDVKFGWSEQKPTSYTVVRLEEITD